MFDTSRLPIERHSRTDGNVRCYHHDAVERPYALLGEALEHSGLP